MKMAHSVSPRAIMGLLVVAVLVVLPLQIMAQGGAELICEPNRGTYGLQIFLKGDGFAPNSQVQIEAFGQTIAPQSDNTGQFMVIAYAPTDEAKFKPGEYTLTAKDSEGTAAETVFTLEALETVIRPTSPAAPGTSGTQPPSPATAMPVEATIAPVETAGGGGIPTVLLIVIVAGVVGLLLLAVAIFFTLARRQEPSHPPTEKPVSRQAPKPSGTAGKAPKQTVSPGDDQTTGEEPLQQGETTLVMPAVPKLSTRPTLQIIEGEGEGTVFSLEQKTTVMGRGEDCDIIVNNPMVSRHHAKVVRVGPSFYIHDLQSTNGTMVNGENIDQHVLQPEDEIQIGVTLLLFQQPNPE